MKGKKYYSFNVLDIEFIALMESFYYQKSQSDIICDCIPTSKQDCSVKKKKENKSQVKKLGEGNSEN